MTKEAMNWNNKIGGKKAERIPCPDGIEGCLVGHYKVIEEQPKQEQDEPVAWMSEDEHTVYTSKQVDGCFQHDHIPLYTTPQRKPLTREDIDRLHEEDCFSGNIYEITAEIEAAHGIKE